MSLIPPKAWSPFNAMSAQQKRLGQAAALRPRSGLQAPGSAAPAPGDTAGSRHSKRHEDHLDPLLQTAYLSFAVDTAWENLPTEF